MENEGWLFGISYSISSKPATIQVKLDGLIAIGLVDYSSESTGSMNDQTNLMSDTRVLFSHSEYFPSKQLDITLFSGFGYRYLSNDSSGRGTTSGAGGYLRNSNYYYSPIGINFDLNQQSRWQIKASLEYDLFWFGIQESYLGGYSGYEDAYNDQNSGYGYRLSLSFINQITSNYQVTIEPFIRHWSIDSSDPVTFSSGKSVYEPNNETNEIGINISLRL